MKLFIDTAEVDEIREAASWGILDGCTTNPSLVAKSGRRFEEVVVEICELVRGPVSAEALHPDVVVKCPMIAEGLTATRRLADEGIKVNVTLVFQPGQGLLAAKAGAAYISPFVGRLDDIGEDGMAMVATLVQMLDNYDYAAEVLVASVRGPGHVIAAAQMGADVATCPFKVLEQLVKHPLTDLGLERFLADWENARK
jgi:transaldolase